jgi:hypothetical protein
MQLPSGRVCIEYALEPGVLHGVGDGARLVLNHVPEDRVLVQGLQSLLEREQVRNIGADHLALAELAEEVTGTRRTSAPAVTSDLPADFFFGDIA